MKVVNALGLKMTLFATSVFASTDTTCIVVGTADRIPGVGEDIRKLHNA